MQQQPTYTTVQAETECIAAQLTEWTVKRDALQLGLEQHINAAGQAALNGASTAKLADQRSRLRSNMAKDVVHDTDKWLCGIDDDAAARDVCFRAMQARNQSLFLWFSAPVRWVARHALIKSPIHDVKVIDLKHKNAVK